MPNVWYGRGYGHPLVALGPDPPVLDDLELGGLLHLEGCILSSDVRFRVSGGTVRVAACSSLVEILNKNVATNCVCVIDLQLTLPTK